MMWEQFRKEFKVTYSKGLTFFTLWNIVLAIVYSKGYEIEFSDTVRTEEDLWQSLEHQKMVRNWNLKATI